jgi:hypothetical protein
METVFCKEGLKENTFHSLAFNPYLPEGKGYRFELVFFTSIFAKSPSFGGI